MSGVYCGLQAKITEENPTAFYMPHSSYSLNLVGNNVAEFCRSAVAYFDFVQKVYIHHLSEAHPTLINSKNLYHTFNQSNIL